MGSLCSIIMKMPHERLFNPEKSNYRILGNTVNTFQYNMKMIMVNLLNISTIYWRSAALIKKKKIPAFKNRM